MQNPTQAVTEAQTKELGGTSLTSYITLLTQQCFWILFLLFNGSTTNTSVCYNHDVLLELCHVIRTCISISSSTSELSLGWCGWSRQTAGSSLGRGLWPASVALGWKMARSFLSTPLCFVLGPRSDLQHVCKNTLPLRLTIFNGPLKLSNIQ